MHAVITDRFGNVLARRLMHPEEIMDTRCLACEYAQSVDRTVGESGGTVPDESGDFRVEFRPDPDNATHVWSAESFYFADEN